MSDVKIPQSPVVCRNLIAGNWEEPAKNGWLDVDSPYTGAKIGKVALSTKEDVDRAVAGAEAALPEWRGRPIKERTQPMFRFRELLLNELEPLSHIGAAESGKTIAEARAGILKGIEVIEFALSLQNADDGGAMEVSRGVTCELRREPMGVVAGIVPFNFAAMVPLWQFPIAVTLGNCFVLKPSEKVPLTANRFGELMHEAGFPAGVFSVVNGDKNAVEALIDNPKVRAVGFVGSTPAAKAVYARAASHGKRCTALGGAKNHLIVMPDADPSVAIDGITASFTGCAGQRCMAASLLVAVGDVDDLLDKVVAKAEAMRLGQDMGAIINKASLEKIERAIAAAAEQGAEIRVDGRKSAVPTPYKDGYWLGPTVIDKAQPTWQCATEELFGPVLTVVRVDTLDEALRLENASPYGNATSVFTQNGAIAREVAQRGTSGMIGVNIGVPVPREPFSFGGSKDSSFGGGDITGKPGVDLWSQTKKITSKWSLSSDKNWMS